MSDFKVQRGTATIAADAATVTLTAGVDYDAPSANSKAFVRVVSTMTAFSSVGNDGGTRGGQVIGATVDDSALVTQIVFERGAAVATYTCRIDWEMVEYIGASGGPHEFVVRGRGIQSIGSTSNAATTGAVSGVVTDADVLPWITGTRTPTAGGVDLGTGNMTATAAWDSAGDTITFTRVRDNTVELLVSWAAVEYIGSAWSVQVAEAAIAAADTPQTLAISNVGDITRAVMHTQQRADGGTASDDQTYTAYLSSTTEVTLYAPVGFAAGLVARCWVLSNSQTGVGAMVVARYTGTDTGGSTFTKSVTAVVMADASVMETTAALPQNTGIFSGHNTTFKLTATDTVTGFRNRAVATQTYRFAMVTWPSVAGPTIDTQPTNQRVIRVNATNAAVGIAYTPVEGTSIADVLLERETSPDTWEPATGWTADFDDEGAELTKADVAKAESGTYRIKVVDDDENVTFSDGFTITVFNGPQDDGPRVESDADGNTAFPVVNDVPTDALPGCIGLEYYEPLDDGDLTALGQGDTP